MKYPSIILNVVEKKMSFDFSSAWIYIPITIGLLLIFIVKINKLNIKKNTNNINISNSSIKDSTIQNVGDSDSKNE